MLLLIDPSRRPVIGHRGNRAHAPEDTLVSFAQAAALGVDALEMDLHLSRDGVPVVIHDPTLDRTTDATGAVADHTAKELARVDAGARFSTDAGRTLPYRGTGIGVPTLEEVLAAHPAIPLILEIKAREAAAPVLALLQRMNATERVLIGSFHDEALTAFSGAGIPVAGATHALAKLYLPALFGARRASLPFQAMCIPRSYRGLPLPVAGYARLMAAAGGPVHVWTVNDRAAARTLWQAGVAGMISDDPAAMIAERAVLA
ncbi:MAG: glycerophosphodiester phosphodiesterase [Gemmatimonadetes bacterium]|nr:glycerophosphodiester phosphodiesterase [Gemmatimonadota bacterium]